MADAVRGLIGPLSLSVWIVGGLPLAASAQQPLSDPPTTPQFLSRFDYRIHAAGVSEDDVQFHWYMDLGGDFDLVDYVRGRLSVVAKYQVVLGDELQPFDPNQSLYTLEASSSLRVGGVELAGVFTHVSRHLSDRAKTGPIAWNTLRGRALQRSQLLAGVLDLRADGGAVVDRSFVDYRWMVSGDLVYRRPIRPGAGWYGQGFVELWGVDPAVSVRKTQTGGRLEGGVRFAGRAAGLELFAGVERVIDANAFEKRPRSWPFAGLRIVK